MGNSEQLKMVHTTQSNWKVVVEDPKGKIIETIQSKMKRGAARRAERFTKRLQRHRRQSFFLRRIVLQRLRMVQRLRSTAGLRRRNQKQEFETPVYQSLLTALEKFVKQYDAAKDQVLGPFRTQDMESLEQIIRQTNELLSIMERM